VRSRGAPLKSAAKASPFGSPRRGGGKYWLPVMLLAVVLFYAQCRWIDKAKRTRADSMDSPIANQIAARMLAMKGIPAEEKGEGEGEAAAGREWVVGMGMAVPAPGGEGAGGLDEMVECGACAGVGRGEDGGPCPLCFGHGARFLRKLDPSERLCLSCAGMGRIATGDGGAETCPRCGGRGLERTGD